MFNPLTHPTFIIHHFSPSEHIQLKNSFKPCLIMKTLTHAPSSEHPNHHNCIQNDHLTSCNHDLHHKSQQ